MIIAFVGGSLNGQEERFESFEPSVMWHDEVYVMRLTIFKHLYFNYVWYEYIGKNNDKSQNSLHQ